MKPPKNGCVCREAVRHYGSKIVATCSPQDREDIARCVEFEGNEALADGVPAVFDPVCPAKDGEFMDVAERLAMRPPFKAMWVETVNLDGAPLGFAVRTWPHREREDWCYVSITGFIQFDPRTPPQVIAAMVYTLDEHGRRDQRTGFAPIYGAPSDEHNQLEQTRAVYPCVRMLQRINLANIGLYEQADPDECNERLTQSHRRKLIGRRYHVLVIRKQADIRAERKVVDYKGVAPLHWARGHYQHYGPASVHGHPDGKDRGLAFGWLSGVFWIEAHRMGKAENGIVDKDYRFAAKKPSAEAFPATPSEAADYLASVAYPDQPVPREEASK